jgi:hypothetical protein
MDQVARDDDNKNSLEKIKQQLNRGSGRVILEGYLLKRSETLRKWNRRWFTLDPSTGKMEYRSERGDLSPRGLITFDSQSTITVSPLNLMKESKYDGCCFCILMISQIFQDLGSHFWCHNRADSCFCTWMEV